MHGKGASAETIMNWNDVLAGGVRYPKRHILTVRESINRESGG